MFSAISNNNRLIAAGSIDTGHGSFAIKVPAVIDNPQDVLDLPIRSTGRNRHARRRGPGPSHLLRRDELCAHERSADHRARSDQAHRRQRHRQQPESPRLIAQAQKSWPPGVHVKYLFDRSTDIHDTLGSLSDSIILAIILVMIIIVAALGLRSGLLVGAAIPTSFLISFLVLNAWA
jgi:multidrug efflux pump